MVTGEVALRLGKRHIVDLGMDLASRDPVWQVDFSELERPGRYVLAAAFGESEPFEIGGRRVRAGAAGRAEELLFPAHANRAERAVRHLGRAQLPARAALARPRGRGLGPDRLPRAQAAVQPGRRLARRRQLRHLRPLAGAGGPGAADGLRVGAGQVHRRRAQDPGVGQRHARPAGRGALGAALGPVDAGGHRRSRRRLPPPGVGDRDVARGAGRSRHHRALGGRGQQRRHRQGGGGAGHGGAAVSALGSDVRRALRPRGPAGLAVPAGVPRSSMRADRRAGGAQPLWDDEPSLQRRRRAVHRRGGDVAVVPAAGGAGRGDGAGAGRGRDPPRQRAARGLGQPQPLGPGGAGAGPRDAGRAARRVPGPAAGAGRARCARASSGRTATAAPRAATTTTGATTPT